MLGRITAFSPVSNTHVQFTGSPDHTKKKHVPAPIATSEIQTDAAADEYLAKRDQVLADDAKRSKKEGATQADVEEAIRKSGSGKISASFAKDVQRRDNQQTTSETRFFLQQIDAYLPTLEKQAADPTHPDHEYAKEFLSRYHRKTPEPTVTSASATTSGFKLEPTVYKSDSGSPTKKS